MERIEEIGFRKAGLQEVYMRSGTVESLAHLGRWTIPLTNGHQHQFSPNIIHMLPREMVMRVDKTYQ